MTTPIGTRIKPKRPRKLMPTVRIALLTSGTRPSFAYMAKKIIASMLTKVSVHLMRLACVAYLLNCSFSQTRTTGC